MASKTGNGVISSTFCVEHPTDLTLWVSYCTCLLPGSSYIRVSSSSSAAAPSSAPSSASASAAADSTDDRSSDAIAFTLDRDYGTTCSLLGCCGLVMRDAVAGLELVQARPQLTTWRHRYNVYRGESLLLSIRETRYAQWNANLSVFVSPHGVHSMKDHKELNEDDRAPDYTLKPAPGIINGFCPHVLHVFDNQNEKIAEARKYPDNPIPGWVCGCGPNYRVSISPGVDQAFIALLFSVYHNINCKKHRVLRGAHG